MLGQVGTQRSGGRRSKAVAKKLVGIQEEGDEGQEEEEGVAEAQEQEQPVRQGRSRRQTIRL